MQYNVDFDYMVEQFGTTTVEADDPEQAEQFAREYVHETYPEACQIITQDAKEI